MRTPSNMPLDGVRVLDFSQFLAGPVAALRLADLGAQVVKVERPMHGEIGRTLAFAGRYADGDTLSFHAMNRNKTSVVADLKDPEDLAKVRQLVARADVLIQNFRPGVMARIGLDYDTTRQLNPRLVYASASGYGDDGPWRTRPGQDLLAQAVSGLPWRSGPPDRPVPVGLSLADHLLSCHLAQGVTALLVRRERTGAGGLLETSLLEGMLDLQFEVLTHHLNDAIPPIPSSRLLRASDGYIAVACEEREWADLETCREVGTREKWCRLLAERGVPCAPLLSLDELLESSVFAAAAMIQDVQRAASQASDGRQITLRTTSSPLRIDGERPRNPRAAPRLGDMGLDTLIRSWADQSGQTVECRHADIG